MSNQRFPEGGKISKQNPVSPVTISRIRVVGNDNQTLELQLEQLFEQPQNTQNAVLAFTMAGHSSYNTGPRKRVVWQNFSVVQAVKLNIVRSWDEVNESEGFMKEGEAPVKGVMNVSKPLIIKDAQGKQIPLKLVEVETFEKREWIGKNGQPAAQKAKTAGPDGDLLTYDGKPIYRNSALSWPGVETAYDSIVDGKATPIVRAWDEDLTIVHNNKVVGSAIRSAASRVGIGLPMGSPASIGQD